MKWLIRILYIIMLVIIGVGVINLAETNKRINYITENAQPHYNDNNIDQYLDNFYVAIERDLYITEPIYMARSKTGDYKFDFSIYHTRNILKKGSEDFIVLVLHNLNIEKSPINKENYEDNNDLLNINIRIKFLNFEGNAKYSLEGKSLPNNSNIFLPMEFSIVENDKGERFFASGEKLSKRIKEITFELEDNSSKEKDSEPLTTTFAKFNNTNFEPKQSVIDELILEDGILQSTKFNGNIDRYDLDEVYKTTSNDVKKVETTLINQYNGIVVKYTLLYTAFVVVVTFLLFFLKPIIEKINLNKRLKNANNEANINKSNNKTK